MTKLTTILLIIAFCFALQCSTTTNVKLLPAKEISGVETMWKNRVVGKGPDFSLTVSNFIFEDRKLTFLKDGKPIGTAEMQISPSLPVILLGWLALGVPYLWIASVKEHQTIDISTDLQR